MPIPWAAIPAAALEFVLFATMTIWPGRVPRRWLPWILGISGLLPYLLLPGDRAQFAVVAALAAIPALWFLIVPRGRWPDLLFVVIMAAVTLSNVFQSIYGAKLDILGKAMWFRLGIVAVLFIAREPDINFGFLPSLAEWRTGAKEFLLFLPVGLAAGLALGSFGQLQPRLLAGLGMFVGTLWFIAVGEEVFFRGLLQRWLGLPAASILFGLAHLAFRQFPNWRHVVLATFLGVFCGRAFRQARSVRASMVTHALVNATWVGLLGKV